MVIQKQSLKTAVEGIFIGKDVWIGAQCFILKGAKINNGAVIGAQSLVNKEIPSYAVAFGTLIAFRAHLSLHEYKQVRAYEGYCFSRRK